LSDALVPDDDADHHGHQADDRQCIDAGFGNLSAQEIKDICNEVGLPVVGNHTGFDAIKNNLLLVFNPDDFKLCPYHSSTGWQTGELATQGWYTKGFLRGDFTLVAENPDSRVLIRDYSVTAADYPALA
jgi:hypothetical protein